MGIGHGTETVATCGINHAALGQQLVFVEHGCSADGVGEELEIGIFQPLGNAIFQRCCLSGQCLRLTNPLSYLLFGIVHEPHMRILTGSLHLIVACLQVGYLLRQL